MDRNTKICVPIAMYADTLCWPAVECTVADDSGWDEYDKHVSEHALTDGDAQ